MRSDYPAALIGLFYAERNREYPIIGSILSVGRARDNSLRIDHPAVAERHLRIIHEDRDYVLEVLTEDAITAVNGESPDGFQPLHHGDLICLGELEFRFVRGVPGPVSRLHVLAGVHRGKVFRIEGVSARVGRAFDNDVQFPDRAVSRHHCRIRQEETAWWIEDLESTNGTLVNGVPLQRPVELHDGDEILAGYSRFVFHEGETTPIALEEERLPACG